MAIVNTGGVMINGINYSWGNITILLFGIPVISSQKIEFKNAQEKSNTYGLGFDVISRGYGNKTYEASIDMLQDDWQNIVNASPNHDPLNIPPFQIRVVFGGTRVTARTIKLNNCEFLENSLTASQGDTKLNVSIPIIFAGLES
jgi:hypothetical protein